MASFIQDLLQIANNRETVRAAKRSFVGLLITVFITGAVAMLLVIGIAKFFYQHRIKVTIEQTIDHK